MTRRAQEEVLPRGIERRDGVEGAKYRVRYRHDGKQLVATYTTLRGAKAFRAVQQAEGTEAAHSYYMRQREAVEARLARAAAVSSNTESVLPTLGEYALASLGPVDPRWDTRIGQDKTHEGYHKRYLDGTDLGATRIDLVTRPDVQEWVAWLSREGGMHGQGLSPHTVHNVTSWLSTVFEKAVEEGIVAANAVQGVRRPRKDRVRPTVAFTVEEIQAIIPRFNRRYQLFILVAAVTGMRWQEVAALRVGDVDLPRKEIRVARAVQATMVARVRIEGRTKSLAGTRAIPIPEALVSPLRAHIGYQPPTAYLFTNTKGTPIKHRTLYNRHIKPVADAVEAESGKRIGMHAFRHSYATNALEGGAAVGSLTGVLGHSTPVTTYRSYIHARTDSQRAIAESMGALVPLALNPTEGPGAQEGDGE